MFRRAGVPRTRRSITRWCEKKDGEEARLDCRKDGNDGRIYISQESIDLAIEEERAKDERWRNRLDAAAQDPGRRRLPVTSVDEVNEEGSEARADKMDDTSGAKVDEGRGLRARVKFLEGEVQLKDKLVEHYIGVRERDLNRIESVSRYIGRLEGRVLELEGPESNVLGLGDGRNFSNPDAELGINEKRDPEAA
jgi:hypothetical protein